MELLKKLGRVLGAGIAAFVIFAIILVGLSFLADYFKTNNSFEAYLFTDSFLKPIALVFVGCWAWLAGKFLKSSKSINFGRGALILWVVVSVVPYFLSFTTTPAN